ncbi:cytochrome c oxidase subunit II [Paenisporosarcina sp. OV554]|uniref:cytochrome c oxidase subunit II n=1 Tax=Paenisporosarcina sp. OV554 TaxID=2135694 RepID=UPI000D372C58|nr:cytochrome c oxidase subunit II [Paenisporosarcina sp. OV554]PUB18054.1 cytochrome c oxidase subunit 2 [Paenisporosarcina sp. OV554]
MIKGIKKWRLFSLVTALMVFLSGCGEEHLSTLTPAGQVGRDQLNLMVLSTGIMVLVIIVVLVVYLLTIIKFRRSKVGEDVIPKQVEGNHTLELIWTIIPIILLLILAVPTVIATYNLADVSGMDKKDAKGNATAVTVNVKANLYWWEFEYPDLGIITAQELVVPTKEKVYFNLKAADVKHSFWIPAAGGKLDTNVENINKFYLEFDKPSAGLEDGVFYGKCAELCGPSHALMDFKVKSLDRDDFDKWVANMQASKEAETPETDLAQQGQELFTNKTCIGCHAVSGAGTTGARGPSLATFGDRNRVAGFMEKTDENVKAWINDPEAHKPGNTMPQPEDINSGKKFTDQELTALTEYLMGLSVEE